MGRPEFSCRADQQEHRERREGGRKEARGRGLTKVQFSSCGRWDVLPARVKVSGSGSPFPSECGVSGPIPHPLSLSRPSARTLGTPTQDAPVHMYAPAYNRRPSRADPKPGVRLQRYSEDQECGTGVARVGPSVQKNRRNASDVNLAIAFCGGPTQ